MCLVAAACAPDIPPGMEAFSAVATTGIYCRPECSARPLPQHVTKYRLAAAAEAAGYRACLRCRPYRSPDALDWSGPSSSAARSS